MKTTIVIPTRDRATWERQHTLRQLLAAGLRVSLVVPREQSGPYKNLLSVNNGTGLVHIVRCPVSGIGRVRRWITNCLYPLSGVVVMLDDDLRLLYNGTVAGPQATRRMMQDLALATNDTSPVSGIGRMPMVSKVYSVAPMWMRAHRLRFGRTRMYEDVDLWMQIQKAGLTTSFLPLYGYRHLGGNARDGVNGYKAEIKRTAWRKLKRLHPEVEDS